MSREDQSVDRTFGDYQDEAGMLPSPSTGQNGEGSAPVLLPGAATQHEATFVFTNANTDAYADADGYSDWFYQPGNEHRGELHQSRRQSGEFSDPPWQWQLGGR